MVIKTVRLPDLPQWKVCNPAMCRAFFRLADGAEKQTVPLIVPLGQGGNENGLADEG